MMLSVVENQLEDRPLTAPEAISPCPRGRGRPPTITLPLVQEVSKLIAKGMTEEQACLRVGIKHSSFRTAKHRNSEFETAIKEAQAVFLDESLDIIGKGGRGWQGRAWILERRHGEQFRRNSAVELSGQLAAFVPADLLVRKPLEQWTRADVEDSVGVWRLLKKWPTEQLAKLYMLYKRCWGPCDEWTDEQLEWGMELEKCLVQAEAESETELIERPLLANPVA